MKPLLCKCFQHVYIRLNVLRVFARKKFSWKTLSFTVNIWLTRKPWLIYLWTFTIKVYRMVMFLGVEASERRKSYLTTSLIYTPTLRRIRQMSQCTWVLIFIQIHINNNFIESSIISVCCCRRFSTPFLFGTFNLSLSKTKDQSILLIRFSVCNLLDLKGSAGAEPPAGATPSVPTKELIH